MIKMSSSYGYKQLQVINDIGKHEYSMHVGCYGCGKTYSIEVAVGYLCMKLRNKGVTGLNIVLLGKTQQTVKKNQCNVLSDCFGSNFKYDNSKKDGKTKDALLFDQYVHIIGLNDKSSESKFRGISNIFCIIHDEAIFCTEEQFNAINSRLRAEFKPEYEKVFAELGIFPPFYVGSTNPDAPTHHIKKLIDKGFFDVNVTWNMNDAKWKGAEKYYERLIKLYKEGSLDWKRYLMSQWVAAEGAIFTSFIGNHEEFIIDSVDKNEIAFALAGLDFGGNKSGSALVITGFYKDIKKGIVVLHSDKLIRNKGEIDPTVLNEWVLDNFKRFKEKYGINILNLACDSAEQYLEAGIRNDFRKNSLNTPVGDAMKLPIMDRVKFFQRMMALGCFKVVKDCETVINSLDTLVYDEKSLKDKVLDNGTTDNDTWDALSYSIEKQINRFNFI